MKADWQCDGVLGGAFGHCSEDRIEVWHGRGTPAIACGRHVEYAIQAVYVGHTIRLEGKA